LQAALILFALGGCKKGTETDSPSGAKAPAWPAPSSRARPGQWVEIGGGCYTRYESADPRRQRPAVRLIMSGHFATISWVPDADDLEVACSAEELTVSSEQAAFFMSVGVFQNPKHVERDAFLEILVEEFGRGIGEGDWETALTEGRQGRLILARGSMQMEDGRPAYALFGMSAREVTEDALVGEMYIALSESPWTEDEAREVAAEVAHAVDAFTFAPDDIWGEGWGTPAPS